jgi:cystathionine beta-lyase
VITTGVHPGLIAALKTFSPPGSKVLLNTPTYNGFYGDLTYTGTIPEENPLKLVNGRYSLDFEDFERRISHNTNTFILCNPQNPTGNCWSAEDLTRLGEICLRRRVVVLADEIHCDWVTKGNKYTPFASLPNKAIVDNSITFKAASKSFGLAAMKCAWFYSTNPDYLARVKANNKADLTTMGMIASKAAYAGGEDWLNQCVEYVDGNHDFVDSFIRANMPLVKTVKPQGTYLSWLDVSAVADKIGAKELAAEASKMQAASAKPLTPEQMVERHFVKHAKVHMNAGSTYGYGGQNHMRMNIATSRKTLELALNNLAAALRQNVGSLGSRHTWEKASLKEPTSRAAPDSTRNLSLRKAAYRLRIDRYGSSCISAPLPPTGRRRRRRQNGISGAPRRAADSHHPFVRSDRCGHARRFLVLRSARRYRAGAD